jgi:hypothetical protein
MAQWLHPASAPFPAQDFSLTPAYWLAQAIAVRDTNPHDYTTDGGTVASPGPMFLQMLGMQAPRIVAYGIWSDNEMDQDVTVQPIGNVVYDQSQPDFPFGTAPTVAKATTNWAFNSFSAAPVEFIAVRVTAAMAPTTGVFNAVLFVYQDAP